MVVAGPAAGAGARSAGAAAGARFIVPSDDTGGTAMTVVLFGRGAVATGATPAGILIVGMPMIVAERGG